MNAMILAGALFFSVLSASNFTPIYQVDHPVSTKNPEVQNLFNQGLSSIYGFNYDLAFNNFKKASEIEPNLAMAYWGMALALGQNINQDIKSQNEKKAYSISQKALELSTQATPPEQGYIKALAARYSNDPKADRIALRHAYRNAMKKLVEKYPEDLDASTLYAESILDLDAWNYWNPDGKPKDGTYEVTDILRSVLVRNPYHIGANHYNIHAWESSPTPEYAMMSAFRLTEIPLDGGHLLHMPAHIFIVCGYYKEAILASNKAIAADRKYILENGVEGDYPLHYLPHNFKMLIKVYMLAGNYGKAMGIANELIQFVSPYYEKMPFLTSTSVIPIEINLYFQRWKELLDMPSPPPGNLTAISYWHYSKAMASLKLGDQENYAKERSIMLEFKQKIPANERTDLGEYMLDASLAKMKGDSKLYIDNLNKAIASQDHLNTDDPTGWYMPIRTELGFAYLDDKQYQNAEREFRKGLKGYQRNGSLLEGLSKSLKGQDRTWDAEWVDREAHNALNIP